MYVNKLNEMTIISSAETTTDHITSRNLLFSCRYLKLKIYINYVQNWHLQELSFLNRYYLFD